MKTFTAWFSHDSLVITGSKKIEAVTPHGAAIELVRRAMEDDGEHDAWTRTVYVRDQQRWWKFEFGCEVTANVVGEGTGATR